MTNFYSVSISGCHIAGAGANQGAFIVDGLTDLMEEAVLKELEAISRRGGVLGAMETGYQRGKIQEKPMYYEHKKHDGSYPIIGANSFRNPHADAPQKIELIRSTEEEKQSQLKRLREFQARHEDESGPMLARLQQAVIANQNVFEVLVDAVRCCSLGQITNALFEVGGSIGGVCRFAGSLLRVPFIYVWSAQCQSNLRS